MGKTIYELADGLRVVQTSSEHAPGLEELQRIVFPTLDDRERFKAAHYLKHLELFPEGQFCVLDGQRVIGMTSTIRLDFDIEHPDHTFAEIIQGGWLTSHQPEGRWLYGADIGTHPDYRGRGVAKALYRARHDVARRLGLAGQLTVGMLSGYGALKKQMSAWSYYEELLSGARKDPTISAQMRVGFTPHGMIEGYISDPVCDGWGVILILESEREVGGEQ